MRNLLYHLGRFYLALRLPLHVSVLLTIAVVGMLIYWIVF